MAAPSMSRTEASHRQAASAHCSPNRIDSQAPQELVRYASWMIVPRGTSVWQFADACMV
jgi:hypothetical protein